jgi:uncharacterized protein (DUF4415 family)
MASKPKFDTDNPEWTEEDFARAKKPEDVLPPDVLAQFGGRRGPQKTPTKVPVSIRLSPAVVRYFKDKGPGWQSRIDEILTKIATRKQPGAKRQAAGSKRRRA